MSTLEKMEKKVKEFATKIGLEAPQTVRLAQLAEDSKRWIGPDEVSYTFEDLFFKIAEQLEEQAKCGE